MEDNKILSCIEELFAQLKKVALNGVQHETPEELKSANIAIEESYQKAMKFMCRLETNALVSKKETDLREEQNLNRLENIEFFNRGCEMELLKTRASFVPYLNKDSYDKIKDYNRILSEMRMLKYDPIIDRAALRSKMKEDRE